MINRRTFLQQIMVGGATMLHVATTTPNALARGSSAPLVPPQRSTPLQRVSRHGMPATDLARRWARDDAALANNTAFGPWTWGEHVARAGYEAYADAPNGRRMVWYFAKGRMEVTRPNSNPQSSAYVSSGALVREMVSGTISTGSRAQQRHVPARVPVVGDAVPVSETITYADLRPHASPERDRRSPKRSGKTVAETLDEYGDIVPAARFADYNVSLERYDNTAGHNIARPFDDAFGADRIAELAGAPLTEPLWVTVPVNSTPTDLLIQLWERRVLVYDPRRAAHERVQWGDVGEHYVRWRYNSLGNESFDPRDVLDPLPAKPLADLAPNTEAITGARGKNVGAAVFDLRSGTLHEYEGEREFAMYSTVKLPIMLALLDQRLRDGRDIADDENELITAMIQESDNDATDVLLGRIGGADVVNAYLQQLGLTQTTIINGLWGASSTTPRDMVLLLGKLANGTTLDHESCTYALDKLRGVVPEQRWGVGEDARPGTVALKNGWFPDTTGWGTHSVGIRNDGTALYAVSLFCAANRSMGAGVDVVNTLAGYVRDAMR